MTTLHKQAETEELRRRIPPLTGFVCFCILILASRLFYLQVVKGASYRYFSDDNRITKKWVPALRGMIHDRNGVPIVTNKPSFDLVITKAYMKDYQETIEYLDQTLKLELVNKKGLIRKINQQPRYRPLVIKRDLTREQFAIIESHRMDDRLSGVDIEITHIRNYRSGRVGAHLYGYMGEIGKNQLAQMGDDPITMRKYRLGSSIGKFGLERLLENYLKGLDGTLPVEIDARGKVHDEIRFDTILPFELTQDPIHGLNVMTTIDTELQLAADRTFAPNESGALIAMNPKTGEILAMVSKPSFDPANFLKAISSEMWKYMNDQETRPMTDRTLTGLYSPGSTFKPLVALAALEEKVLTPDFTVKCSGKIALGNHTFSCWKHEGHGTVDLYKAITQSCDVYFYKVGSILGIDTIAKWSHKFHLGRVSDLGLNNEKPGLVPTSKWKKKTYNSPWQLGETLVASIGQGYLSVTPIQLAIMTSIIANDGVYVMPKIYKEIGSPLERIRIIPPLEQTKPLGLHRGNLDKIKMAMLAVVNQPGGTAYWFGRDKDIQIAGKTGSVQVVSMAIQKKYPTVKKYKDHALFIAFAPYENPEIVVVVVVEHGEHGSSGASPKALQVIKKYMEKNKVASAGL